MTPQTPQSKTPQAEPAPVSRNERVRRQREVDARVQLVRRIEDLAIACKDPELQAIVSFVFMGLNHTMSPAETATLASAMLAQALKQHADDAGADPLPEHLQWVHELVDARGKKSPSMKAERSKEEEAAGGTPVAHKTGSGKTGKK